MSTATLHDGSCIDFTVEGDGPALLLSAGRGAQDVDGAVEALAQGVEPRAGARLSRLLSGQARTVVFDYEGHVFDHPKHRSLTLDNIAHDMLTIATAAGIDRFAFYGSSWLALVGPHLAAVSRRLTGYAMGGFPPIDPPLQKLLGLARRHHAAVVSGRVPADLVPASSRSSLTAADSSAPAPPLAVQAAQARQFVTFFTDALTHPHLTAPVSGSPAPMPTVPRTCFVGKDDVLTDADGTVLVSMAAPVTEHGAALTDAGWTVHVLEDTDGLGALQPDVIARVLQPWIGSLHGTAPTGPRFVDADGPVMADRVDAYLTACGVDVGLFDDDRLREATRELLLFLDAEHEHLRQHRDTRTASGTVPRRRPGNGGRPSARGHQSDGPPATVGATRENLEVMIIRRLNELAVTQPSMEKGQGPDRWDVEDLSDLPRCEC